MKFPKGILAKMTEAETKKMAALEKTREDLVKKMEAVQGKASEALDEEEENTGVRSKRVQGLINNGFKALHFAVKAADAVKSYQNAMRKKYRAS